MTDWAAWAQTGVSIVMAVFVAGMVYGKQKDHDRRLLAHDQRFEDHDDRFEKIEAKDNLQDIALTKLESWRDGYNAASAQRNGL